MNLLKTPIFEDVNKYIAEELRIRYAEIVDKFFHDLNLVLTPDQQCKIETYLALQDLDSIGTTETETPVNAKANCCNGKDTIFKGVKALAKQFYLTISVKLDQHYNTYSCTRVEENALNRCVARTGTGKQCTRAHNNSETKLCGSHSRSNPHGKYGEADPLENAKMEKKIQNSHKTVKNLKGIDMSDYISTIEIELDDKTYLLDDNGILYDQLNLNIVAHIQENKVYWFNK